VSVTPSDQQIFYCPIKLAKWFLMPSFGEFSYDDQREKLSCDSSFELFSCPTTNVGYIRKCYT